MRSTILLTFVVTCFVSGSRHDSATATNRTRTQTGSESLNSSPANDNSVEQGKWFLEIVSESSDRPFTNTEFSLPFRDFRSGGYLFEAASEQLPPRLFPSTGNEPASIEEFEVYLGFRILDLAPEAIPGLSPPDDFELRTLLAVKNTETVFDGETFSREELLKARAKLAARRPKVPIRIERHDDGIVLKLSEQEFKLKPGKVQVLQETSGGTEEAPSFHRLTAVAYKNVEVASFDALHQWNLSQQLMSDGPYTEALAATENVLLADPADEDVLAQWQRINYLIEAGKTASVLEANLKFAAGLDATSYLKQWTERPAGLLYLSEPDAPLGEAQTGRMLDAETVKLPTPSGRYRVTLLLPGFRPFQQEIEINGRTNLEIPIERPAP